MTSRYAYLSQSNPHDVRAELFWDLIHDQELNRLPLSNHTTGIRRDATATGLSRGLLIFSQDSCCTDPTMGSLTPTTKAWNSNFEVKPPCCEIEYFLTLLSPPV